MTQQPKWKLIATLGDLHPIDYGGYFVFVDETGCYTPEAEYLESPDDDKGEWRAYRFILEPCTYINGILSDNKFHPDYPVWFADTVKAISDCCDQHRLIELLLSDDPCDRAEAWRCVGYYHGFDNLDSYPLIIKSRSEVEARYKDILNASVN